MPARRNIFLLNGTGREQIYLRLPSPGKWQISSYTHDLEPAGKEIMLLKDGDAFDVPSGGAAILKQTSP